jgi:hypothetical protein
MYTSIHGQEAGRNPCSEIGRYLARDPPYRRNIRQRRRKAAALSVFAVPVSTFRIYRNPAKSKLTRLNTLSDGDRGVMQFASLRGRAGSRAQIADNRLMYS